MCLVLAARIGLKTFGGLPFGLRCHCCVPGASALRQSRPRPHRWEPIDSVVVLVLLLLLKRQAWDGGACSCGFGCVCRLLPFLLSLFPSFFPCGGWLPSPRVAGPSQPLVGPAAPPPLGCGSCSPFQTEKEKCHARRGKLFLKRWWVLSIFCPKRVVQ